MSKLKNVRHEKFCQNLNLPTPREMDQTKAYVEAGYKDTKNARIYASELLTIPNVIERNKELQQENQQRVDITKDKLLLELAKDATAKIKDDVRRAEKHKAIEIINKMCGYNDPEVVDINVTLEDLLRRDKED